MRFYTISLLLIFAAFRVAGSELRDEPYMLRFVDAVCSNMPDAVQRIEGKDTLKDRYCLARKLYLKRAEEKIEKIVDGNKKLKADLEALPLTLTSIERLWSEEHAQRKSGPLSLAEMVNAADQLAELKARIEDPDDFLIDIDNYKRLLLIPTYSGQIYNWVEKIFFKGQIRKAETCFNFFLLDENTDDFTRGAAIFFIARAAYRSPADLTDLKSAYYFALPRFLETQRYATCLTYISYAYIWAAKIYARLGCYKQAIALAMIDVPSVDLAIMKKMRHKEAYLWALHLGDKTNAVKHIQEWACYDPTFKRQPFASWDDEDLWNYCATNRFNAYDKHLAVAQALQGDAGNIPEYELLTEALLHPWPNVDELPENIATNRVLNNNIFDN